MINLFKRPRVLTMDDAGAQNRLMFYVEEKLGDKQALTPEGFLLCLEVPICRTGSMQYGPGEVPVSIGPNGFVTIYRNEDQVFTPEHIASYAGKSVANDHPPEYVTPENWKQYTVGVVLNPRRGTGLQMDMIIADLLITEPDAIQEVRDGKREVSCGYHADYEETKPGEGIQKNLIGNHVALVNSGRCGQRCAIGDHSTCSQTLTGDEIMAFTKDEASRNVRVRNWWDTLCAKALASVRPEDQAALKVQLDAQAPAGLTVDEATLMGTGEGGGAEESHIHVHAGGGEGPTRDEEAHARLDDLEGRHAVHDADIAAMKEKLGMNEEADPVEDEEIEGQLEEEAPPGTNDRARMATDSAYMADSFQDTVAACEILAPGMRFPTFDRKADPRKTLDAVCKLRRSALDLAYQTTEGRGIIETVTGGRPLVLDSMKCSAVRPIFIAAAAMKRAMNNDGIRRASAEDSTKGHQVAGSIKSIGQLQAANRAKWDPK